jgi:hypothetical protein
LSQKKADLFIAGNATKNTGNFRSYGSRFSSSELFFLSFLIFINIYYDSLFVINKYINTKID